MSVVILPLVLITLAALAVGYWFDRRFETALPVTVLGVMLVLYAFYAFDLLRVGRVAVIAVCAASRRRTMRTAAAAGSVC